MPDNNVAADEAGSLGGAAASSETPSAEVGDWLVLALLTAALAFSYIDRYAFALLMEPIKHALKVSDAQLGLINGVAFGLCFTVMGIPLGRRRRAFACQLQPDL